MDSSTKCLCSCHHEQTLMSPEIISCEHCSCVKCGNKPETKIYSRGTNEYYILYLQKGILCPDCFSREVNLFCIVLEKKGLTADKIKEMPEID